MNHIVTYYAIFKKETDLPVALFLEEQDAQDWHANPSLYTVCRRRVCLSPQVRQTEAERLLRILVMPGDHNLAPAIEAGQQLLNIKPAE